MSASIRDIIAALAFGTIRLASAITQGDGSSPDRYRHDKHVSLVQRRLIRDGRRSSPWSSRCPPLFDLSKKTLSPVRHQIQLSGWTFAEAWGDNPGDKPMLWDALLQIGFAVFVVGAIGGMLYFEAATLMAAAPF
jgi:hypothetical protein